MDVNEARALLSTMTDQQRGDLVQRLSAFQEGADEKETPDTFDKIQAGWASMGRASGTMSRTLTDIVKEHFANKIVSDVSNDIANDAAPKDEFQKALDKESMAAAHKYASEVKDAELDGYKLEKKMLMLNEYKDVWGTEHQESIPFLIGQYSNYLLDETTLIPLPAAKVGGGFIASQVTKAGLKDAAIAATSGAAVVGYDNAAWQLFEKGEIDLNELQMWITGGATMVPLITIGGKKMASWIGSKIKSGTPVNPNEVGDALNKYLTNPKHDRHVDSFMQNLAANRQTIIPKLADKINSMIKPATYKTLREFIDESLIVKPLSKKEKAKARRRIETAEVEDPHLMARKYAESLLAREESEILNAKTTAIAKKKSDEMDKAWKDRAKELDEVRKMEAESIAEIKALSKETDQMLTKGRRNIVSLNKEAVKLRSQLRDSSDPMDEYLERRIDEIQDQIEDILQNTGIPAKEIQKVLNTTHQGGWAQNMVINHFGMGVAGGAIGGATTDSPEGAAMGFLMGLGASVALMRAVPKAKNPHEALLRITADDTILGSVLDRSVHRPTTILNSFGAWGRKFADDIGMAEINMNMMTGRANEVFARIYKPVKDANLGKEFIRAMQGIEDATSMEVRKAVNNVRQNIFWPILDSAHTRGIITKEEALAMKNSKTYWPRVYNQMFLQSKEGQDLWVKKFSEIGTKKKETLMSMIDSIMGTGIDDAKRFKSLMYNARTQRYHVDEAFARELYRRRSKDAITLRSTHLENKRKINLAEEDFLNEFMISDPEQTMLVYTHDAYKRIAFADKFGARDEGAKKFLDYLAEKGMRKEHEYVKDLYYGAVGSENSALIRAQTQISDAERNLLGSVNAFETLKLTAAQVLNTTQATVNGLTYASKYGGGRALSSYMKGLKASFTGEGQSFARRTGAAIETTFMQLLSDSNVHATITSAFGKGEFTGGMSVLNRITNPSKFLETIGFVRIEKFQRTLAANMGRAFIDDLLESRQALMGKPLNARSTKQLAKLNSGLKEMNINPLMSNKEIYGNRNILDAAAQTFSNTINHTNSIEKLPLSWRGPYARTFLKFKSFAFHQGAFINDHVIRPALKGNIKPLIAYLGVGGGLGMGPDEIRRMIRSDDSKLSGTERYLRGLTSIGGAGLIWDGAITFATNPTARNTWGFVGGPAVSDVHKLTEGAYQSFKKNDPRYMAERVFSTIGGSWPGKVEISNILGGK